MHVAPPFLAMVKRELLSSLRETRTYALLALNVGALFLITSLMAARGMSARNSESFFALFTGILYASGCLFVTPTAANSVCVERLQGTYDLLRGTLIRPAGIIAAKIANVVVVYVYLVVACLPLLGVLFFFAGVDRTQVVYVMILLAMMALACGAIGVLCSTLCRKTMSAMLLGYAGMAVFLGPPIAFWTILIARSSGIGLHFLNAVAYVWCPPALVVEVLTGRATALHMLGGLTYQGLFAGLCVFWAIRRMKRTPDAKQAKSIVDAAETTPRVGMNYVPIQDGYNPMFVKEQRVGTLWTGASGPLLFCAYFLLTLLLLAFFMQGPASPLGLIAVAAVDAAFLLMLVPAVVAGAMAKEREQNSLDLLRTTLLKPDEIILGKAKAALMALLPLLGVLAFIMAPAVIASVAEPGAFPFVLMASASILVAVLLVLCLSLCVSITAKHTSTALVRSYVAVLSVQVLFPIAATSLANLIMSPRNVDTATRFLTLSSFMWLIPSPLACQAVNLSGYNATLSSAMLLCLIWLGNMLVCFAWMAMLKHCAVKLYASKIARDK